MEQENKYNCLTQRLPDSSQWMELTRVTNTGNELQWEHLLPSTDGSYYRLKQD
jgi:hypothetical protein